MSKKIFMFLALLAISFTQLNMIEASTSETHTVTFIDFDDDVIEVQEVPHGGSARYFEHTRIGYIFVEWSGSITNVTEDRVVQAIYTPKIYVIDFLTLDGSIIISANLPRDYVIEELNPSTELMFQVGWTPTDEVFTDFVVEEELYQRVFVGDNILRHVVATNFGTQVTEYTIEVDGYDFDGWDGDFLIKGAAQIQATFTEKADDNVVVDPEDPEEEVINFTENDLNITVLTDSTVEPAAEIINGSVGNVFLISAIDSLVDFLEEDVLVFPELEINTENGVSFTILEDALIYAEDKGIDLQFHSQGYTITIPSEGLTEILNSNPDELIIEIREPSTAVPLTFDLNEEFEGATFDAIEVNLKGGATEISNVPFILTLDSTYELVIASGGEYSLMSDTANGSKTGLLQGNVVIIQSTLTEIEEDTTPPVVVTPEERFDAIEWIQGLDTTTLILGGVGSYLAVYLIVYVVDTFIRKD